MKVLVIGSGGREHALVWKISRSRLVSKIFAAPGNAGIAQTAECLDIKADDIGNLLEFARGEKIDLTVVGPEVPLVAGIADEFIKYELGIFGPGKKAAQLEASKVFAKQLMARYDVPTADFRVFEDAELAKRYIETRALPCVIKADGLAQGKGVVVARDIDEARQAIESMMQDKIFGKAGDRIIVEDCLEGEELSVLVLTDSKKVIPLACSQDHKRIFDADLGPNTGGMGAYSPVPLVTEELFAEILNKIIYRIMAGLVREGIDYRGVLYAGIMITKDGPKVLEFNVRFGDPETQAILPRLESDLLEVMLAVNNSQLDRVIKSGGLIWMRSACVCVVCAAGGYPGEYERGKEILGLDAVSKMKDILVFHAGTKASTTYKYLTNGGRVLGVSGLGNTLREAIKQTYQAVSRIHFEGMHYRRDIGYRAVSGIQFKISN